MSAITLFLQSIWCVGRELSDVVDSIRQLSLNIHWRFQGLQLLCFPQRFIDQPWHTFFTILCVSHDSSFAINLMCRSSKHLRCQFHTSAVTQFSLRISMSIETQFSLTIYELPVTKGFSQFHALAMTLYLLSIGCIVREFRDVVDSIHRLPFSIDWWFQGLQLLCFRLWFMDQLWQNIFNNSISQPWLYFCYRLDASFVNSVTLSIPYVGCHSVFIDDFKFYRDIVYADDL